MPKIAGLKGYCPNERYISEVTSPPYDVIKPGSPLENLLKQKENALYHILLGSEPVATLQKFLNQGVFTECTEPSHFVYKQEWEGGSRLGVLSAIGVEDYSTGQIIRHEKTFDDKVKGRLALARQTGLTLEPIFLLTKSPLQSILETIVKKHSPQYQFTSDFKGHSELHGIKNTLYRVPEASQEGQAIASALSQNPLYIADGHHRYHAALLNKQSFTLAYICQEAKIQAYNRVINGKVRFEQIRPSLPLQATSEFVTPPKNSFCIYTKEGTYLLKAKDIPHHVVERLDCSLLEKQLYPHLQISHDMILNSDYFDYYPERDLGIMKEKVDSGDYDLAVALHPVSLQELMDVADAGLKDPSIIMPEKSTFFAPKILSGLILFRHEV